MITFGYDQKGRLHCSKCGQIVREAREESHRRDHRVLNKQQSIVETRITIPLENAKCLKCGILGQKKLRRRQERYYLYFDHYEKPKGMNNYHGKYERSCYIGKISQWESIKWGIRNE